jgi:hypothetical protein
MSEIVCFLWRLRFLQDDVEARLLGWPLAITSIIYFFNKKNMHHDSVSFSQRHPNYRLNIWSAGLDRGSSLNGSEGRLDMAENSFLLVKFDELVTSGPKDPCRYSQRLP